MDKLTWYLKGGRAYGWRYYFLGLITKSFYKLHLIDEQTAIIFAKKLHDMWLLEVANKAGLKVVKVDLEGGV